MNSDKESIRWFRVNKLPEIEILAADNTPTLFRHFHQAYAICVGFEPKRADWTYRGKHLTTGPGGIMMMEPGENHVTTHMSGPTSFRVATIPAYFMERAARDYGLKSVPHFRIAQSFDKEAFTKLHRFMQRSEVSDNALELESLLTSALGSAMEKFAEEHPNAAAKTEPLAVARAKELLRQRWDENLSLSELASGTGLSRFHLLRVFARQVGVPPHAYQIHLRLAKARHFLQKGLPLSLVAGLTGFADQSHFGRNFKKYMGVTPAAYQAGI